MRIISGKYKGRRIYPPKNINIRPTTDFAKEGLFNILHNSTDLEGISVLDLFSGTGNISYEFISRGCKRIVSVDKSYKSTAYIKKEFDILAKEIESDVVKSNVFRFPLFCSEQFDIIFADPPYNLTGIENIPDIIFENELLNENGLLIVEHSKKTDLSNCENFNIRKSYGSVNFSFFRK